MLSLFEETSVVAVTFVLTLSWLAVSRYYIVGVGFLPPRAEIVKVVWIQDTGYSKTWSCIKPVR